jgi:hypothetical protein
LDPQAKSLLSTILGYAAASVGTFAVTHGIIPGADQSTFDNDLVGAALWGVAALIGWWKKRQHTPRAQIAAVNQADNGVKVVAQNAEAQQVNVPLK